LTTDHDPVYPDDLFEQLFRVIVEEERTVSREADATRPAVPVDL
jgi:hypothetical protein